jgi:hypothetical protein
MTTSATNATTAPKAKPANSAPQTNAPTAPPSKPTLVDKLLGPIKNLLVRS